MLALATFGSICIAAVLFLLRFLVALNVEAKLTPTHAPLRVAPISTYRSRVRQATQVADSPSVLTLVRVDPSLRATETHSSYSGAFARRNLNSEIKAHYKGVHQAL
jgi:hypothetical protein